MNYAELITETDAELTELADKQKLVQYQRRMRFLWLLKTRAATTQQAAGEQVGWKLRQSQKMWQWYRAGGVAKLLDQSKKWQTGKLSRAEQAEFKQQLAAAGGVESLEWGRRQIKERFGVEYSIGGVSDLCARLQIKLKTARPVNIKRDEVRAAEYKKTLARLTAKLQRREHRV